MMISSLSAWFGHPGNGRHADDLAHLQDLYAVFFIGQHEADQLDQLIVFTVIDAKPNQKLAITWKSLKK